jgi:hypothetical protein
MRKQRPKAKLDSSNILRLVPTKITPRAETIAVIKELLALAEQGKITGLAYAGCGKDGTVMGATGMEHSRRNTIRGILFTLAMDI